MIGNWFARFLATVSDPIWSSPSAPPRDRKELGLAARRLLDDPVLHFALDRVEDNLIRTWKASDPADRDGRERIYATYDGMRRFKGELQRMIGNASESLNDANQ